MQKRRIVILGAGESGTGAALLAQRQGYDVFVSDKGMIDALNKALLDKNHVAYEEGGHHEDHILNADEVVKSPGIPGKTPLLQKLQAAGVPVISEIEFAARFTDAVLIGITGSNGKTTTSYLVWHLMQAAGKNVALAGNVGQSLSHKLLDKDYDYFVLELSSFQLEDIREFHPHIALLLNITPDHLDRYDHDFDAYVSAKFNILKNMAAQDYLVYNQDDAAIRERLAHTSTSVIHHPVSGRETLSGGIYAEGDTLHFNGLPVPAFELDYSKAPLQGVHNKMNVLMGVTAAVLAGANPRKLQAALKTFQAVPHRLEEVGEVNGVRFVNDSKATNVDAVYYALESFHEPVIWIAGGTDKGNDYLPLQELVQEHVKALIAIGDDPAPLEQAFAGSVSVARANSMEEAIDKAMNQAAHGDVVLLSPACASFDWFRNYEERGDRFRDYVQQKTSAPNNKRALML